MKTKRTRDRERVFVLEGPKPIFELLHSAPRHVVTVIAGSAFLEKLSPAYRQQLFSSGCAIYTCPEERFARLSDLESSSGVLAVVRQPTWDQAALLAKPRLLGLYGDGLRDPTNIGTIIRTAAGLNVSGLWLAPQSADVYNPKIVRATAGSIFHLPIFSDIAIEQLLEQDCAILAADSTTHGSLPLRSIQSLPARTIVAIGSESRGLSEATLRAAKLRFTIPLKPGVESLNAAASAAIVLFHLSGLPISQSSV
ncbi:MAG: putative rRNA methyltransferase RlmB [Nitrospira sp.]|jgi:TrmH family RNA methyltransferase|nr:putative rRNA methyltransferase RlmB [Nitrospira sp.]